MLKRTPTIAKYLIKYIMKRKINHSDEEVEKLLQRKKDETAALKKIFEKLSNINKNNKL